MIYKLLVIPNSMGWPDKYTKKAHAEGYAARSIYKLKEIDAKLGLLKKRMTVLDLGCYPGSFMQYIAESVGESGLVVGVDIQKVTKPMPRHVKVINADVFSDKLVTDLENYAPFDVIMSDMAPRTTGTRALDQSRSCALVERAYEIAQEVGRDGSKLLVKYFQGGPIQTFISALKKEGVRVRTFKPKASRAESYEMFMVLDIERSDEY